MTIFHKKVLSNSIFIQWQYLLPLLLTFTTHSFANNANTVFNLAKVYSIKQDSRGFIWLSGHQGITRFDGNNSINFSANSNTWSLPFTWTHTIEPEEDHFVVATENNGSWTFDPATGNTSKLAIDIEHNSHYHTIKFQGEYYTYSGNSIYRFNPTSGKTTTIHNTIKTARLYKTSNHLYFTSHQGLYVFQENTFSPIISEKILNAISIDNFIVAISASKLWVVKNNKVINQKNITTGIHAQMLAKENSSNNFFIVADNGEIAKYQLSTLNQIPHGYASAKKARVKVAFHDSSNVLWLVTNYGVERLTESTTTNHPIVFNIENNANEITLYQDELLIGSYGLGIQKFNPKSNIISPDINNAFTERGLKIMDIINVGGNLYIATFDGLWKYSSNEKKLFKLNLFNNDGILLKLYHKNGLLFVGSNDDGLFIYDIAKARVIDHISVAQGLTSSEVIDILSLDDGNVWLATSDGISIFNQFTRLVTHIPSQGPSKYISLTLAENKIFSATLGDGIYVYDRQGTLLSTFAKGIEFSYGQLINDQIWIGATLGLYLIDPHSHQYNLVSGTENYSFSGEAKVFNNKVFLSHYSGILEVPLKEPEHLSTNVHIGKTIVSGQQSIQNTKINVSSASDVITLDLVSLDYRPGQNKQFKYKINDGVWNNINGEQLTLTGLTSGIYQIEIMATNSLGQWSNNRAFVSINVAYPWYWTLKIRILYAVLLSCIIALIAWTLYLRAQSLRQISLILTEEFKQKGKHTMLTRRNIQQTLSFLNDGHIDDAKELLQQNLSTINMRINEQEPNNLFGKSFDFALPYLSDYLHQKYHVNLTCEICNNISSLEYELQANLYKVIYEAVTCAILHGDGRNFHITLQKFKDKLWLTITDDETSFSNFTSVITFDMSMYYIRQIANIYHATVNTFELGSNKGSQLVLSFPLTSIEKMRA